ncbi:hypothetical protein [Actinoplanes flavus]|uniref:hypothetical protein n=1 Tax=Actinoplanes flavus TaxID=2820290 RepID=UPI001ABC8EEB|nr:hypothetical protein [Actinoplanes flavus]
MAVTGLTLISGCHRPPTRVDGPAVPVGAAPPSSAATPSPTPSRIASLSVSLSVVRPSPTEPAVASSRPKPLDLVLGPDGAGPLKLGMTLKQALATGVVSKVGSTGDTCSGDYWLETDDGNAQLHFKGGHGLVAISAYWGTRTVEGIEFNSSYAEVLEAYPDFAMVIGGNAEFAYGEVDVPGNRDATYNIRVQHNLVDRIDLEMRGEACY